jgi:hypothetical protein
VPIPALVPDSTELQTGQVDFCEWIAEWGIDPVLGRGLVAMQDELPFQIEIFSGYRTKASQDALRDAGRPTADEDRSNHRTFPARAADVRPRLFATNNVKATLGAAAFRAGLRWGGGAPVDPETGIPINGEWRHVDLGPRPQGMPSGCP